MSQLSYFLIISITVVFLMYVMSSFAASENKDQFSKIYTQQNNASQTHEPPVIANRFPESRIKPSYSTPAVTTHFFQTPVNQNVNRPILINPIFQRPTIPAVISLQAKQLPEDIIPSPAIARPLSSPHHSCQKYLQQAAEKTGVLPKILWAVAKKESNHQGGPWPWTLNVAGKGYYFPTHESAKKFLKSLSPTLKYRVDVGCMQVNWGYHGKNFSSPAKMLNPGANTIYGALFLKKLYQETGSWAKAIAAYHSRNWNLGGPYASHVAHLVQDYRDK